jgi:Domain of unknown function (DUF397)
MPGPDHTRKQIEHMASDGAGQTVQPLWRKASFCASNECVEVSQQNAMIVMRNSKEPSGLMLHYSIEEWQTFIRSVKAGEFDNLG